MSPWWPLLALLAGCPKRSAPPAVHGEPQTDWSGWGRDGSRNMAAPHMPAPGDWSPGDYVQGTEEVDMTTTRGIRWVAKLGSQTYGNPTVADGRVFVGTNNAITRREGFVGDYSVVKAFAEDDATFLWQFTIPKLGSGKVNDWEYLGVCSAPTVVGDVVYVVTTRGEVAALDVHGLRDGNQGDQDELAYMTYPGDPSPYTLDSEVDADLLWRFDMPTELGVFPHNVTSSSVLVVGDRLFVTTSNGVDWSHLDLPSPFAPALIVLDRHTGALVGEEMLGISERTLHANWSSPTWVPPDADRPGQVVFGAGDGWLYGLDPEPVDDDGLPVLRSRWRVDGNPAHYRTRDGQPIAYATPDGPSEFIATPVYAEGKVYAAIGQDPEHGPGLGRLTAVAVDGEGEVEPAWTYDDLGRSISTVAVHDGIVYAADYDGVLVAIDADTGALHWRHPTGAHVWGSPFVVGDEVWLGNEDGILTIFSAGETLDIRREIAFPAPIYSTPVAAGGVVYLATQTHLYAIDGASER